MRTLLGGMAWLVLLCCATIVLSAAPASAQVVGRVESIGLGGVYRPGCWVPMLVKLQSQGSPTGLYELRVRQFDADGDQPYFSTRVTLTQGRGEQGFWTYFLPEPIHSGLMASGTTLQELAQRLRITVHDASGRELAQVTVGNGLSVPESVEPVAQTFTSIRGRRLVLFIAAGGVGGMSPPLGHYDAGGVGNNGQLPSIVGLQEDLAAVQLRPDQLPESALGYDGVDAIVWLDGDPTKLNEGGSRRLEAIRDYVSRGGHLVLSTPPARQQLLGFGDLLPVDLDDRPAENNAQLSPAKDIANAMPLRYGAPGAPAFNPWDRFRLPFAITLAQPRPGAVVDRYTERTDDPKTAADYTPWLVRKPVGYGCVSWVAQDLGDRILAGQTNWGWPRVWELILGSGSQPQVFPSGNDLNRFRSTSYRELGATVLDAMNLTGRAATLVGVTVLFFVAYWAAAGPGTYFLLRYRGRATASWFWFGAVALAATALTLAVVRVVLRGSAEVKHVTLMRIDSTGQMPAMGVARLGIYVPRDGRQTIALADADPRFTSTVEPFPIHPTLHARRDGDKYLFPSPIDYVVHVPTGDENPPPSVDVPFRTTMKRVRADWFGPSPGGVDGTAALRPTNAGRDSYIAGTLTNRTGHDLRNVYVAFRHQSLADGSQPVLWMMYVARWKAGDPLDLGASFNPPAGKSVADIQLGFKDVQPNDKTPVRGRFPDWASYFAPRLRSSGAMGEAPLQNDLGEGMPTSVPMLSFFNQFPAVENPSNGNGDYDNTRADLHRSGLRDWDVGHALLAGRLVVVAQADGVPLPVPLSVDGDRVEGAGTSIYQFVLPLSPIPQPPASQPTTTQATTKATTTRAAG